MTAAVRSDLLALVSRIRRRWRLRVALQGLTILLGVLLGWLVLGTWLLELFRFAPAAVQVFRILGYVALAGVLGWFVLRPAFRRASDEQIALYIEEHEPGLHALLVSAVEQTGPGASGSPALAERIVADAVARMRAGEGHAIDHRPLLQAAAASLAIAVVTALGLFLGLGRFRDTARLLLPWRDASAATPYAILIEPGDATVARGGDQEITARLRGFTADRVELLFRKGDEPEWQRATMAAADTGSAHVFRLFDVTRPIQYVVEADGVRSPQFTLSVAELPTVGHFAVELRFPAYSGLPPERQDPAGDIVAPRGTTARFEVTPTLPSAAGRIVLETGDTIPLRPGADSVLVGESRLVRDATYRIELQTREGHFVEASLRYHIDLLDDQGPTVLIRRPGRDVQATAVEEVFVEAEAADDFGIRGLELAYRVNGGPEQVVRLHQGARRLTEVTAGHTYFLEELGLQPGDVITYFARATDNGSPPHTASSDLYFLRIRPFGREYRQAEQGGGMPGQGGDTPEGLSEQQRQIVAGTFKVLRDRPITTQQQVREDLATLALAQGRLRERVAALVEQLERRNAAAMDSTFGVIQRELELAVPEMQAAEEQLGRRTPDDALGAEQRALTHVQRAEEAFRQVTVSFGQQGGGGGGGQSQANAEDLADLFELETDKLRNQYETLERSEQRRARQEVDETLERLRQLAARQQQENERLQRAAEQLRSRAGQTGGGSDGGGAQRRLAQEAEELARRLERLAREQPSPEIAESARRLREAAEAMRRSAAGQEGGASDAQGAAAAERLREATRSLERSRQAGQERAVEDAARRAEALAGAEREIGRDVERAIQGGAPAPETSRALGERKDSLAVAVDRLGEDVDRLAREIRPGRPDAGRRLADAATGLREDRVSDRIRFSKGLPGRASPEYVRNFEEQIATRLDSAATRLRSAARELAGGRAEEAPDRALDRARRLVRGLESLRERVRQGGTAAGQQEGGQSQQQGGQAQAAAPGEAEAAQGGTPRTEETRGGRPAWLDPRLARQFGRELRERRLAADSLRAEVEGLGLDPSDLDAVIAELRALESRPVFSDATGMERLERAVLDRLKAFEFALRRQLEGESAGRPVVGAADQVPPKFRELVEEYYRSLARSARQAPRGQRQ